jgi:transposase
MSNARIEATNNKIKLIIRKAYGFRNIQNMLDMVYLVCSDLRVPLLNRKSKVG